MTDIKSLSLAELEEKIVSWQEPKYRAKQVFEWLHKHLAGDVSEMTNLPKKFREKLAEEFYFPKLETADKLVSEADGTIKFLFRLEDSNVIESVLMRYEHGYSVCISSQVGCRMGCSFCASTIGGKIRDLTAGEMLEQIYHIEKFLKDPENTSEKKGSFRVSNVVVMGTGEPFDNFENFCRFYERISDPDGFNLSGRNITVSTCGLADKIYDLAEKDYSLTLAISLHAPNDILRQQIMPVARAFTISQIMKACDHYFAKTGRRITFEYSLINDVNDTEECARELSMLLKGKNCHVNLIPVNPVKERNYTRSDRNRTMAFKNILEKNGINATIRRGMGRDIDAACGQLRRSYYEKADC
ncbi:MAG: 23S rRNA (adenine(2503)-C(2))-methyltransferase RlmN [Lachnospiraceae bacterium]|nr:23S rRNA (adenine(2503)-C(2))-methyltransferase RlmN [Lachnospiraceae bacterium]